MRFDKFIAIPTNLAKRPRTRKRGGTENSANLLGLPEYEGTIADWAKEMYSKVNLRHNQTGLRLQGRMMTSCVGYMTNCVGFTILPKRNRTLVKSYRVVPSTFELNNPWILSRYDLFVES